MISSYDVIRSLLRSEKGTSLEPQRKYFFRVNKTANKVQIRKAVEDIYKVKVQSVHTGILPGKIKRVRQIAGRTNSWKKAIVTLKEGQKIEIV